MREPLDYVHPTKDTRTGDALPGMLLRDWFAGQALAGYLAMFADPNLDEPDPESVAEVAYRYADAMMRRRNM